MGKRIIISEEEKKSIKGQYGLINEIDMETLLLGGGGIYFIYKFIKDFIGIGLFNRLLKNPKHVDKLIKNLEDKIVKKYSNNGNPEDFKEWEDELKKITKKFGEDLKRKLNNGEFVNLWQYFDEAFKVRDNVFDEYTAYMMKDINKELDLLHDEMRKKGGMDDEIKMQKDVTDVAAKLVDKYRTKRND